MKSYYIETPGDVAERVRLLPETRPGRPAGLRARLRPEPDRPLGRAPEAGEHGGRRFPSACGAKTIYPRGLAGEAFLADVLSARADPRSIFISGGSGRAVSCSSGRGGHLLLDPYLSDSLTKKYARTDKPHVRITELAVAPERLDFIDVATSSHNHTDHLDAETLLPLLRVNPALTMIVPAANCTFAAERLGVAVERLTASEEGKPLQAAGFPSPLCRRPRDG